MSLTQVTFRRWTGNPIRRSFSKPPRKGSIDTDYCSEVSMPKRHLFFARTQYLPLGLNQKEFVAVSCAKCHGMCSTQGLVVMHINGWSSPIAGIRWRFWERSHTAHVGLIEERIARASQSPRLQEMHKIPKNQAWQLRGVFKCFCHSATSCFNCLLITCAWQWNTTEDKQDISRPCFAAWLPSGYVSTLVLLLSALQSKIEMSYKIEN